MFTHFRFEQDFTKGNLDSTPQLYLQQTRMQSNDLVVGVEVHISWEKACSA